jgi:hypothetical protein
MVKVNHKIQNQNSIGDISMSKFSSCCGADETKTYNAEFPFCPTCGDNCEFLAIEETETSFYKPFHPIVADAFRNWANIAEKSDNAHDRKVYYPTKANRTRATNLYNQKLDAENLYRRLHAIFQLGQ